MLVYVHIGTVVAVYASKGTPCIYGAQLNLFHNLGEVILGIKELSRIHLGIFVIHVVKAWSHSVS